MKRSILLIALLWTAAIPLFALKMPDDPGKKQKREEITSLVINAHVTVVLINANSQPVRMGGNNFFLLNVEIRQVGGQVLIETTKKRDLKNKGVIYIPAGSLKYIEINSAADVSTASFLNIPALDVLINGECKVDIANRGLLNIKEGPYHEVRYQIKKEWAPAALAVRRE